MEPKIISMINNYHENGAFLYVFFYPVTYVIKGADN